MFSFSSRSKTQNRPDNAMTGKTRHKVLRLAYAQPRLLALAMVLALGGIALWSYAQNKQIITKTSMTDAKKAARRAVTLADLPGLVQEYGRERARKGLSGASVEGSTSGATPIGPGNKLATADPKAAVTTKAFALTEVDLTPGNISDEREPAVRPSGDFIAFVSNGVDIVNNVTGAVGADQKIDRNTKTAQYHIWVMRRNGSGQRQITGFSIDSARSQRHPSWSPDGNRLVYVDGAGVASQLFITNPFNLDPVTQKAPIQQLTFFNGEKRTPAWGPSGSIAFVTNVIASQNGTTTPTPNNNFDIFSVDSAGSLVTLRRLTGGTTDVLGDRTDDLNPSYSLINVGVLFFSSNRDRTTFLPVGRRIWSMSTTNGSNKRQITNPAIITTGRVTDVDDYPSPSLAQTFPVNVGAGTVAQFAERLAFERNSLIDITDVTRDINIWSLPINSTALAPPPTPPAAALTVSSFTSNRVRDYSSTTGNFLRDFSGSLLAGPEDVIYGPDLTGDGFPDLYVANRNRTPGTIEVFNGATGVFVRTYARGSAAGLQAPTGLAIGQDGFLYVASGTGGNVFRIFPFGTVGTVVPFTTGTSIAGGIEGITFGTDIDNDGIRDLYAAALLNNKISVFSGFTGAFIRDFVPAGVNGPLRPTGVIFGPDKNGDSVDDLYVASSLDDTIKIYDGASGLFINNFVSSLTDITLNAPERLAFGRDVTGDGIPELYVTVFISAGLRVNRYNGSTGASLPALGKVGATFVLDPLVQGASGLAFNPIADGSYVPPTSTSTPIETALVPGRLETNLISSPRGVTTARFPGAVEDKSADREPNFARSNATSQTIAQIVFASQRTTAAAPANTPANPKPLIVNPGGGPQFTTTTVPQLTTFTHDIWTTSVQDFTPPVLIPVAVGGQLYPALAPGVQAPFTAPRTVEEGLTPGGKLTLGFVVQDLESGLASAGVAFKDADRPTFITQIEDVEFPPITAPVFAAEVAIERPPQVVSSVNPITGAPLTLRIFDNGPVSAGGNERQQNAIAGDGTYYCEGSFSTVDDAGTPLTGDYYIDLILSDTTGNVFTYDHIYGFSTKEFARNNKVLLVSDFTVGQFFPVTLQGGSPFDFARSNTSAQPCESYYLTNPGGTFVDPTSLLTVLPDDLAVPVRPIPDTTTLGTLTTSGVSGQADYADVWRILSRGPVPLNYLLLYSPQITEQLAPNLDPDNDRIPGPYRDPAGNLLPNVTRQVAVANSCVVWASPYTGNVFAGPGTLFDGSTQRDLTAFLDTGGRLFVSGQDVAFALTNNGTVGNDFMQNELKAGYGGETITSIINGTNDPLIPNGTAANDPLPGPQEPPVLINIPFRETLGDFFSLFENVTPGATWGDAARNQLDVDVIAPGNAGASERITALYNYSTGGRAAQRVERQRPGGVESRLVYFAFGFEAVHRTYRFAEPDGRPRRTLNTRAKIFYNMTRIYFYTGGISGTVFSAATNQPIPNFLIEVLDNNGNQLYVGETDENGEYEILGIPFGGYLVRPLQYNDNGVIRSANGSFFPGPNQTGIGVAGGETRREVNFRVQPAPPGSISGRAISDKGTISIADDASPAVTPAVGVPVLLRSIRTIRQSASLPQRGFFAAITVTDGAGRFTFRNVPSNEFYELVFNPRPGLTNATIPSQRGDIPPGSGVVYPNPDSTLPPQPNLSYGRRIIPVDPNYGLDFTNPAIRTIADDTGVLRQGFIVPIGQDLNIGDVPIPPGNGPGTGGGGTTPVPTDDFQIGSVYMISVPWMDNALATATTTPDKAFTLPPVDPRTGAVNYRLTRFDPLIQGYVVLTSTSLLRRGEGYFMRPVTKSVSFRRPGSLPARVPLPTTVNTFTITLRRSPSLAPTNPNNGFNIIGFPFNPAVYKSSNWTVASVYVPATGARYNSVTAAAAAGVLSSTVFSLTDATGVGYTTGTKLVPLKGYFAKTFVDNVQVTLVASTMP